MVYKESPLCSRGSAFGYESTELLPACVINLLPKSFRALSVSEPSSSFKIKPHHQGMGSLSNILICSENTFWMQLRYPLSYRCGYQVLHLLVFKHSLSIILHFQSIEVMETGAEADYCHQRVQKDINSHHDSCTGHMASFLTTLPLTFVHPEM
jgi:hypothetical protein